MAGDCDRLSHLTGVKSTLSREVARIAARQFGVISLEQLLACGLTYRQVQKWVEQGHLHRLHRGVFAVGHTRLVDHAHLIAALLACGPESFLSHRTAAGVWGLRPIAVRQIAVTIVAGSVKRRTGLVLHRTIVHPHPHDLATRNDLRVSSIPRLLIELAPQEKPGELNRLITQAARKRVLDSERVEEALARHARRRGVAKLKLALAGYRPGPDRKSGLEIAFDAALEANPDIPEPLTNVVINDWEIDCYWPKHKVAVELDGRPYHIAVRDMEKDRFKDGKLLGMGIRPLRITDVRFEHDPEGAIGDLRTLLALG